MAEPRIAIITMVRRSEFPAAASSLATISANLGPNRRHFVLVNDDRDEAFELNLAEREDTELLAPGVNLGVARGRNALIEAALAWGATYIASVDDDLLLPSDYLDRMLLHIQSLESQGANPGVVGPAIVDFHGYADACMTPTEKRNAEIGRLDGFCSTEELAERIRSTWPVIPSEVIYHLGVRHWQNHYLTVGGLPADQIRTLIADLVDDFDSSSTTDQSPTELHRDPKVLRSIARRDAGPVRVDGIPGGACIFSSRASFERSASWTWPSRPSAMRTQTFPSAQRREASGIISSLISSCFTTWILAVRLATSDPCCLCKDGHGHSSAGAT